MDHENLDVYRVSLELVTRISTILRSKDINRALRDQVVRSSASILLRVAALVLVFQLGGSCIFAATLDSVSSTPLTTLTPVGMTRSYVYHWTMESKTTCPVELRYFQGWSTGGWDLYLPQSALVPFGAPTWKDEIGIYPENELLAVLEQTLTDFRRREPEARLDTINVSLHVVTQMWTDFISKFAPSIKSIRGESEGGHRDALRPRANAALKGNPTVRRMIDAIRRAGYSPTAKPVYGGPEKSPDVEEGIEWKKLAQMPNAGLATPCYVTIRVTTETKAAEQGR